MEIINKNNRDRLEDLSIEELRDVACFKHLNDEVLQEAAMTIKKFTQIAFEIFSMNRDEAPVINMTINKIKAA